jgi:hypothetical protein
MSDHTMREVEEAERKYLDDLKAYLDSIASDDREARPTVLSWDHAKDCWTLLFGEAAVPEPIVIQGRTFVPEPSPVKDRDLEEAAREWRLIRVDPLWIELVKNEVFPSVTGREANIECWDIQPDGPPVEPAPLPEAGTWRDRPSLL